MSYLIAFERFVNAAIVRPGNYPKSSRNQFVIETLDEPMHGGARNQGRSLWGV